MDFLNVPYSGFFLLTSKKVSPDRHPKLVETTLSLFSFSLRDPMNNNERRRWKKQLKKTKEELP